MRCRSSTRSTDCRRGLGDVQPQPSVAEVESRLLRPAVKPIALHLVSRSPAIHRSRSRSQDRRHSSWRDAAEFIALGAGTLRVCTAVMHYGFRIVEDRSMGCRTGWTITATARWPKSAAAPCPGSGSGKSSISIITSLRTSIRTSASSASCAGRRARMARIRPFGGCRVTAGGDRWSRSSRKPASAAISAQRCARCRSVSRCARCRTSIRLSVGGTTPRVRASSPHVPHSSTPRLGLLAGSNKPQGKLRSCADGEVASSVQLQAHGYCACSPNFRISP